MIKQNFQDGQVLYTYDLAGNKLTSTEEVDGQETLTTFTYDDNRVFTASRAEGKNTYQLFQRRPKDTVSRSGGKKSPYTAPDGEENSLFWYGFSQNVLQSLSTLPQTVGSIWHEIFDDVSIAYHQKVAKDRATKEGLVVNPPDENNLPGQAPVIYASEVADILIPYTTKTDSYNYYEVRNYVNDVNRKYTQVLQTYDDELKARETYTYGNGRASYLDNSTDKSYDYLTNQSGSVTGLVQDGLAVASSSYSLYGSTTETTDTTGNPFAYNGEARDSTGLDYLRARYYDSQVGTFLTEDSYQGELTSPLSQNRYSYVQNNPVNYTDPSGHFSSPHVMLPDGGRLSSRPKYSQPKPRINYEDGTLYASSTPEHRAHQVRQKQTGVYSYTYVPTSVPIASAEQYVRKQEAQARAQVVQRRQQHIRDEYRQATGLKTTPKTREANSLFRNWGKALKEMYTHVCKTADRVKKQVADYVKKFDWKKAAVTVGAIGVGIAFTVATGGLGAPVAMAIGGAASGAIMSGYDAYSSGQRGWALAGSIAKGAGTGAVAGFLGGQFVGAGASVASNVTQNLGNQTVRQVVKIGVESAFETAIDTGIDLATGNKITGQTVAMNFAFNTFTNGAGSVSSKKATKADVNTSKPKAGDVEVLPADYKHNRPLSDVSPPFQSSQKLVNGPDPNALRLEAPKTRPTWKQSEIDAGRDYSGYSPQKSFMNGQEVSYTTPGSVRPEYYAPGHSVEVKNYNLESKNGKYNLVNNVSEQIVQRNIHLPSGTRQTIIIDIRGQNVSDNVLEYIDKGIRQKTGTDVEIKFKGD